MKRPLTYLLGAILLGLTFACSDLQRAKTIKLGHGLDVNHPVHLGIVHLAERMAEKSSGNLIIEVFPNQQLGTERQCLELLQIGSVGMAKVSAAVLENFAPNMKVLSLPYIFRSKEHAHKVFDGPVGQDLLTQSEKFLLRGVCFYDAGARSFYTKDRPVHQPADLEGLKIRVQESITAMELVRTLGGSPTPISWGELYTALQQGIVDGAENNPPSFHTSGHYEVCKYYSINEHSFVPDILIISTAVWNSLSAEEQGWLQEAARESVAYQRKIWEEAEALAISEVKKAGVEVIYPDKALFMTKLEAMLASYQSEPEVYEIIQAIQNIQ